MGLDTIVATLLAGFGGVGTGAVMLAKWFMGYIERQRASGEADREAHRKEVAALIDHYETRLGVVTNGQMGEIREGIRAVQKTEEKIGAALDGISTNLTHVTTSCPIWIEGRTAKEGGKG